MTVLAACTNTISTSGVRAAIPEVRVVAEKDLDCPQSELRITEELGGRLFVVGCGRKATYKAQCDGLSCVVRGENESIPFHDRPEPGSPLLQR
ncbi:MAG TPA: hypothetical protein VHB21_27545 [Minicystis sp.]|nr:hypothetical protein [Minicystis sp.]